MKRAFLTVSLVLIGAVAFCTPTTRAATTGQYCPSNTSSTGTYCSAGQTCDYADGVCVSSSNMTSLNNSQPTSQTDQSTGQPSGFIPLAPIPGLTQGVVANSSSIASFLNNLYYYLVGLAAILAVIEIVWGGLEISTKDSVSKQSNGKQRITHALLGLILILSPVLVFSLINPSILNLSVSIPQLDTQSGPSPSQAAGGAGVTTATDQTTGCSVSGVAGILQIATCSSSASATTWGQQNCADGEALTSTTITNSTNGVAAYVAICAGNQNYVFINTKSTYISIINGISPLVSTPANAHNGSDAMTFASICSAANLGLQTCVNHSATFSFSVPCNLTGANAATTWKCYNENLSCETNSYYLSTASAYCTSAVEWVPFQ